MTYPEIRVERHPPERWRAPIRLPLACCCSCCCCLHSVGGIIAAVAASKPPPATPPPKISGPLVGAPPRPDDPTQKVLSLYLIFRAADMAARKGRLPAARFEALVEELARRVEPTWKALYGGRDAEAYAWILERLHMIASEGALSKEALKAMRAQLAPRAGGVGSERIRGAVATLWCLATLHRECTEAAARGELDPQGLPRIRDAIHRRTEGLLAPASGQAAEGGAFSGLALRLATEVIAEIVSQAGLQAGDREVLLQEMAMVASGGVALADEKAGVAGGHLPPTAACEVCGEGLTGWPMVLCAACETPYHTDCWDYNGRCATFACGALDFVRPGGRAPARIRFDLVAKPEKPLKAPVAPVEFDRARIGGVTHYWAAFFVLVLAAPTYSNASNPLLVLIFLPFFQLGASFVALFTLLAFGASGRRRPALRQLGKITLYTIGGSVIGGLIFPGACLLFR